MINYSNFVGDWKDLHGELTGVEDGKFFAGNVVTVWADGTWDVADHFEGGHAWWDGRRQVNFEKEGHLTSHHIVNYIEGYLHVRRYSDGAEWILNWLPPGGDGGDGGTPVT